MKIKYIAYALIILGFGAFIFYRISENKSEQQDSKDKGGGKGKPMRVTGIVVKPQSFDNNLSLSGSIEANEQVEIRSEVSGVVESINFTEGSNVSKGQLLFKVNDIELRAQLGQRADGRSDCRRASISRTSRTRLNSRRRATSAWKHASSGCSPSRNCLPGCIGSSAAAFSSARRASSGLFRLSR